MIRLLRPSLAFVVSVVLTAFAHAELPIIAKARAYLGGDAPLDAIRSVHYVGKLTSEDKSATGPVTIEIIFQKPDQQRIVATSDKGIEMTGLNGYEGWQRVQDPSDSSRWQLTLLSKEQIKRLRANTWENLAFFRGIERVGGTVEDQGSTTLDGVKVHKVAFIHSPDIIFYRYFDETTGRLVLTETEAGGRIREQGEMMVQGVRFPQRLITSSKNSEGKEITVSIAFDKITLNEDFSESLFAVPALSAN